MIKTKNSLKPRNLELKRETIAHLPTELLKEAVGGNNSTIKSQCKTLCFT